jgi:hypothetical protein
MRKPVIGLVLVGLFFGPASCLLAMGVVLNPAAHAACLPSSVAVEQTPDHLTARTSDGISVTLDQAQLTHAATIVSVGAGTRGVGRDGILIALMAALTESHLRMLSNTNAYPGSASYSCKGHRRRGATTQLRFQGCMVIPVGPGSGVENCSGEVT